MIYNIMFIYYIYYIIIHTIFIYNIKCIYLKCINTYDVCIIFNIHIE